MLYPHKLSHPRIASFDITPVAWLYGSSYGTNRATLQDAINMMPQIENHKYELAYTKIKISSTEPADRAGFVKTAPPGTSRAICVLGDRGQANSLLKAFCEI